MKTKDHIIELERKNIEANGYNIPNVVLKPVNPKGTAVIVHGYGGCKKEMLGLSWRIAEFGFTTCAIDLRGHGEHPLDFDKNILLDQETTISYFKGFGKVTAIGHSLGGRFSLISNADFKIGISPAIAERFAQQTQDVTKQQRDYRVRKPSNLSVFDILNELPMVKFDETKSMIIYGSQDIPEIVSDCKKYESQGLPVTQIEEVIHRDSFLHERTYQIINKKMQDWYR